MSTSVTATPRSNHKTDPPMCVSARAPAFPPFAGHRAHRRTLAAIASATRRTWPNSSRRSLVPAVTERLQPSPARQPRPPARRPDHQRGPGGSGVHWCRRSNLPAARLKHVLQSRRGSSVDGVHQLGHLASLLSAILAHQHQPFSTSRHRALRCGHPTTERTRRAHYSNQPRRVALDVGV